MTATTAGSGERALTSGTPSADETRAPKTSARILHCSDPVETRNSPGPVAIALVGIATHGPPRPPNPPTVATSVRGRGHANGSVACAATNAASSDSANPSTAADPARVGINSSAASRSPTTPARHPATVAAGRAFSGVNSTCDSAHAYAGTLPPHAPTRPAVAPRSTPATLGSVAAANGSPALTECSARFTGPTASAGSCCIAGAGISGRGDRRSRGRTACPTWRWRRWRTRPP